MLKVNRHISIPPGELEISAIRAGGPGGQNVNKVSSAIHLRFDIEASSLDSQVKARLRRWRDRRINKEGIIVIKAQRYRDQEKNRNDALQRLATLIRKALYQPPKRIPTRPGAGARRRRLKDKARRGQVKSLRRRVTDSE
jgi:ribosome-associated protein